jgi:hypothetical protein
MTSNTAITFFLAASAQGARACTFPGERVCERISTIGGSGRLVIGVTTLRSNGALVVYVALSIVCDLVWHCWCTGEAKIGWDRLAGFVCSAALEGAFGSP